MKEGAGRRRRKEKKKVGNPCFRMIPVCGLLTNTRSLILVFLGFWILHDRVG